MKMTLKVAVLVLALLAFGAGRLSYESALTRQLEAARLFPAELQLETRDRVDQTSWAVALGGLRTLVASMMNLRAFTYFTEQRWEDVKRTYDSMVDLAPRTRHYWETGSWHQAYNAASYYLNDSELPPARRRELWRASIHWGRAFLERGIRNNPDDPALRTHLGMLLMDPNKFIAFKDKEEVFLAAAAAYDFAAKSGKMPAYAARFQVYALARVEGREAEALRLARVLHARSPQNRTPTLLMLLYVFECHADPGLDVESKAVDLFGSPRRAYDALSKYWLRSRDGYPVHGMAKGLKALETTLNIATKDSVLNQTPLPPPDPSAWFRTP